MIYATRLNSLKKRPELYFDDGPVGILGLLRRAGEIERLGALSLNYPEHFETVSPREVSAFLESVELGVDSLNIRFPEHPFGAGASRTPRPRSARRRSISPAGPLTSAPSSAATT